MLSCRPCGPSRRRSAAAFGNGSEEHECYSAAYSAAIPLAVQVRQLEVERDRVQATTAQKARHAAAAALLRANHRCASALLLAAQDEALARERARTAQAVSEVAAGKEKMQAMHAEVTRALALTDKHVLSDSERVALQVLLVVSTTVDFEGSALHRVRRAQVRVEALEAQLTAERQRTRELEVALQRATQHATPEQTTTMQRATDNISNKPKRRGCLRERPVCRAHSQPLSASLHRVALHRTRSARSPPVRPTRSIPRRL